MGNKKQRIIPAHYSWNSSIITRGIIDPIKRKLGWVDENERPVSLKESATGQELDRIKDTAKDAGKLVATGLAFGNPITAGSVMAPLITGSQAYFMTEGLKDAYDRVTSPNKTATDGAMVALDVAGAVPAFSAVRNGTKYVLPTAAKTVAPALIAKQISKTKLPTVEPTLNIGWGPKQTLKVSRAGEYDQMYFPKRWDVVNEGANPHGVWLQGKYGTPRTETTNPGKGIKAAKARNIFSARPDKYTGAVILDKPMVTVGEVPNRSSLSYQADNMGADGLIYNGVYDNGYNNNQVILSFRRPELTKTQLSEAEWLDIPKDLSPNISRSLGFSSTTGEELFMPNEILGEFVSGKNQAAKFFKQPVVQNSYAHNKELANRLGINIADRPENISEIVGAPIKLSPYIQNPGNELANIAQSYLGDPNATLSIAWTPFSKRVAKLTGIHEGLHRGHYAQVIKPAPPITKNYYETTMRPEATFWNWKINKLLKPEYQNGYLGGPFDGEAGVNLIEMGRDMGVKLGTKYPGDEVFMNMINNYNGHKSFLIPHLNLDTRAGRRHVWDAMTGQYFKQGGILKRVESGKSGIHIKPENRGKFTETMKRTGKSAEELSHSKNPVTRKRAIFALNARKWHHGK